VDPQDLPDVVQAPLREVQGSSVQGSPIGRAPDDHADRASDRKEVALRLPQGKRTSELRTGENASSEQHERTPSYHAMTCEVSQARDGLQGASPQGTEPQEESEDGKAVYTGTEESKTPKGEGRQVSHGKDGKVRERRTAETLLPILQDRGKRQLPLDDVDRQLSNPDMSLRAYSKVDTNDGAMTPGITEETVDGRSRERSAKIIEAIRHERWPWNPVRRIAIPKRQGGKRPLGMSTWSAKVVQEVIRSILEASYEPHCSHHSHGCRPKRRCHTARTAIHDVGVGTTWFLEGDIQGGFDNIAHPILMHILRENIRDHRFLRLIEGALKAGDGEAWPYHPSRSGSPQGGRGSPRLSHLSMARGDRVVQETRLPEHTQGRQRAGNPAYSRKANHI